MRAAAISICLILGASAACADEPTPEPTQRPDAAYRLFRTQNIFTFLRLDTRTGEVWQLQWSNQDDDHRFIEPITLIPILPGGTKAGRFTLYPAGTDFCRLYKKGLIPPVDGLPRVPAGILIFPAELIAVFRTRAFLTFQAVM